MDPTLDELVLVALITTAVSLFIGLAVYVVVALLLQRLLKQANHDKPISAWVPIWNTASVFQVGGIHQPWAWVGVFAGLGVLSLIPFLGVLFSLAAMVVGAMLMFWVAKGVYAGFGVEGSTAMYIVAVIFFPIWLILITGQVKKENLTYDGARARAMGATLPVPLFKDETPPPAPPAPPAPEQVGF